MSNTVCALPGCPTLVPTSSVSFTDGYCDAHLLVAVIDRLKTLEEKIERAVPAEAS